MEIWKNYSEMTQVSNLGNVMVNGVFKPYNGNPKTYRSIGVGNRRTKTLHRIVYELFSNTKITDGFVINHKDGNKQNNAFYNLEMITQSENLEHSRINNLHPVGEERHNSKLKNDQVLEVRKMLSDGVMQKDIAKAFNVSKTTICNINKGNIYTILRQKSPQIDIIEGEVWKHYNDDISVSNKGRVVRKNRLIHFIANGYYCVSIDKYPIRVHQLVWFLFGDKQPDEKWMAINHLDGNIHNNDITNLDLVSYSENSHHAYRIGLRPKGENHSSAKLSDDDVLLIRFIGKSVNQKKVAEMFGVGQQTISRIQNYKSR